MYWNTSQPNPCVDCRETDPAILEFDHVLGEKSNDISVLIGRGSSLEAPKKGKKPAENCKRKRILQKINNKCREYVSFSGFPCHVKNRIETERYLILDLIPFSLLQPGQCESYGRMKKHLKSRLGKPLLLQRTWERILSYFFFKQWVILITKGVDNEFPGWDHFTPLIPPADRLWADPFVWVHHGNYYIFFEERLFSTNRGQIACITLDQQMNFLDHRVVLERPYHLSYPFIFEYQDDIYMIPETEKNRSIELYRCTGFPNQWVFVKILLPDIRAVDATLLEANGKWWLFANIREGVKTWDTLHLFHADHFLSDQWISHPRNPIVKDIRSARPAGRIFLKDGQLIRPSQDCSVRYGYAINFNRICVLSESDYSEVSHSSIQPPMRKHILGTHTWNESGGLTTIDALIRMPRHSTQAVWPASRTFAGDLRRLW